MAKSEHADRANGPAPDLLVHLGQAFGWSEAQATEALGAYLMSTEAGQAVSRELAACNRNQRAA